MNKLKLDIQFFADCFTPSTSSNELEIYVRQLKRKVDELMSETQETLLNHDGKIAELSNYISLNLENTLRCLMDSMIASGELDTMIKDLLSITKISVCRNVVEMQGLYVSEGTLIQTLGYHYENDGGASTYFVRSLKEDDVFDDGSVIMLSNSLVAELLFNSTISVKQFGAYGDNSHDDTTAFRNANLFVIRKTRKMSMGSQSIHSLKAIIEIPNGVYKLSGTNILGSSDYGSTTNEAIGFKVIGNNSTIVWYVNSKDDNLFFFDNTITNPVVEDLEILTINENATSKTFYGNIFRITAPQISGTNYGDSSGGIYKNLRVVGFRNNKFVMNVPQSIFNIDGNVMCDQSHVIDCKFIEFGRVMKSTNSQAVNWVFDRCSIGTSQEKANYFEIEKCNDNFVIQNSSISLKATQTILKAICPKNSSGKITERGDYHFTIRDVRCEIVGGISDVNYYPVYINYGNVLIENINFMLGSYSQSANPTFYLEAHGSLVIRNSNVARPTFVIPCVDNAISGIGNYVGTSLVVDNCVHNGYTLKINQNGNLYNYSRCIADRFSPIRKAVFKNFSKISSFRSEDFEIIANSFGVSSTKNFMSYSNNNGVALGEVISLPPHQVVTKVILHTRGTLPTNVNRIRVYFGNVSNNIYKEMSIDPLTINSNKVIYEGMGAVISDDVTKQTITAKLVRADGTLDDSQIISTIDVEYMALSPYNHFYKTTTTEATYVL